MAPEKDPCLQPSPSWSSISLDMAGLVLRMLPAYADRARFAMVCPQWRAAARQLQAWRAAAARQIQTQPLPLRALLADAAPTQLLLPSLPLLALLDGTFYSLPCHEPFQFPGCGFAGFESTCGSWLVFPRDDWCFLVDPFSREEVRLPALSHVRHQPENVFGWSRDDHPFNTWLDMEESEKLHLQKLILCSANLVAALVGGKHSQILICQPEALTWSVCVNDKLKMFEDMAFYQGKLYAVTKGEDLLVVNISQDQSTGDPQVSKIGRVIKDKGEPSNKLGPNKKLFLVESRGMLLMVRRTGWFRFCSLYDGMCTAFESEFEVFEADFEHSRWVKVSSAGGDQVLFLGRSCSKAVPVSQYRLPGDRIFFLDDYDESNLDHYEYCYNGAATSCSAYDMILGEISSPYPLISWKCRRETRLAAWLFPQD